MIVDSWDPAYDAYYDYVGEKGDPLWDNTPMEKEMIVHAPEGEHLNFGPPEGAGIKSELVGI